MPDSSVLINRFERDILYDCHGLFIKLGRSKALKGLVAMRRRGLTAIVYHLGRCPPTDFADLHIAWACLLNQIENKVDPQKTAPLALNDTEGWIAWAEKFAI